MRVGTVLKRSAVAPVLRSNVCSAAAPAQTAHTTQARFRSSASKPLSPAQPAGRRFADLADFVKGPCNELALTAALQICEQPGSRYNPLVLYGGVGTGKTHLLEASYRRLRAGHPALRVMFLSAEGFANHFTQALRDRSLPSFRQRFRSVDVLIIDDVDFLDGKRVIQEEFLHTVKQLESHDRQIVLSADRHPRLLTRLSEELVTRFISGIVCRMESPDLETRRAIVARKAARLTSSRFDRGARTRRAAVPHERPRDGGGTQLPRNVRPDDRQAGGPVGRPTCARRSRSRLRARRPARGCGAGGVPFLRRRSRRAPLAAPQSLGQPAADAGDVPGPQDDAGRL